MAVLLTEEQVLGVRERIRAVAERQVAAHGPDGISLRSIAAELGWTAASLYRYYSSKAQLLDALRTAAHDRFSEVIEAAHDSTDDLWDRSRAIGDAYVEFAANEPAAYRLMFAYALDEGEKSAELQRAEHRSNHTLTDYVREMVESGLLEGDADLIAHAYWAAIHGLVMLRMAGKLDNSPAFETLRHAAMRMITRGARA